MGAPHLRSRSCGHLPRFPNPQALWHFALVLVVDFRSALGRLRPHGSSYRAFLPNRHRIRIVETYPREMNCDYAPTINEIIFNRKPRIVEGYSSRPNKYREGEWVEFSFCGLLRRGRITHAICDRGVRTYNIVAAHGTWYQEIEESNITSKIYEQIHERSI